VQLLNRLGRVQEAMAALKAVSEQWPDDPMVRTFLRNYGRDATIGAGPGDSDSAAATAEEAELRVVIGKAHALAGLHRSPIAADAEKDVLIGASDSARATVLIFTGSNDGVSLPLEVFDRYLAALDLNAVYLKDFNRLRFLEGVRSLGSDFASSVAALRQLLGQFAPTRLLAIGNCDGGFAAIRYGVELDVERVVTFCAPTFNPPESLTKVEQARNFMRKRLAARFPAETLDLRPFLEERRYRTQIDLFFEEDDARDRNHALHLEGVRGVELHPQKVLTNHFLLRRLAATSDNFAAVLEEMLGLAENR
jgi:hypothetical protein